GQLLRAYCVYEKDVDYVVQDNKVVIVDQNTGRALPGRRWSDGLHQAVEAKEGVTVQQENQTLATITFQNYFRMYEKLAGMTGTADTEAYEFQEIYGLETVVIPPNRPTQRKDELDLVYKTEREKYDAVVEDIRDCVNRGQPVLVGTTSIETSEYLSALLNKEKLPHQVLNAKQHAREAEIVAQAGRPKMITIATNMAGRGTDIVLGGNVEKQSGFIEADASLSDAEKAERITQLKDEWQSLHEQVKASGGLHIVGTERHESRRIDNQLRGRAGRQGDPGSSRFYLSLDDQLLRIFAGDRVRAIMERLKMPEGEPIEAGIVTRSIESAQRKVEGRNFDIRKQLLQYDDVANDQRKEIYKLRNDVLESQDVGDMVANLRESVLVEMFREHVPAETMEEQWDIAGLEQRLRDDWGLELPLAKTIEGAQSIEDEELLDMMLKAARELYDGKVAQAGRESFAGFERSVMLQSIDTHWREHLAALDHLRQGIHLRGYAQKDPKQEYKRESFELFARLLDVIKSEVTRVVFNVRIQSSEELEQASEQIEEGLAHLENVQYKHDEFAEGHEPVEQASPARSSTAAAAMAAMGGDVALAGMPKVGRNDPCPCGSGKKFKQCHGKLS
ncbi:MAG: SEC-C domain-containing protein, partial [Cupriavidus sp.]|nr:SEC-C domain-containing protein [Cupriavidus sp.]